MNMYFKSLARSWRSQCPSCSSVLVVLGLELILLSPFLLYGIFFKQNTLDIVVHSPLPLSSSAFDTVARITEPTQLVENIQTQTTISSTLRQALRANGWALAAVYVGTPGVIKPNSALNARWTSQWGQDRTVARIFENKSKGFFIDLAAHDAVALSNTLTLEQEFQWDGLCIEANPRYYHLLYQRRCMVVQAVAGQQDDERIRFALRDAFGGVVGEQFDNKIGQHASTEETAVTVSLARLFQDMGVPSQIDYMSLDIEGAEEWVLESFPWNTYQILVLTIERPKDKLKSMLLERGYYFVRTHGTDGDTLWIHSEFPGLMQATARAVHVE